MNNPLQITYQLLDGEVEKQAFHLLSPEDWKILKTAAGHGFAAVYQQEIIGITLFRQYDQEIVLYRIFVDPRFRRFGVGTEMLCTLCALAEQSHCEVLFSFEGEGIGDGFYRFVASTGLFTIRRELGYTAVLSVGDLEKLCEKYVSGRMISVGFFGVNHLVREGFLHDIQESYPDIVRELHSGHVDYREDFCRCILQGSEIQACCLVKEQQDDLELKFLYSRPDKGVLAGKVLLEALGELGRVGVEKPARLTPVGIPAVKLMDKLCPSRRIEKYIYTAYYTGNLAAGRR